MSMEMSDLFEKGMSNCCSAKVYLGGRCADCKENCEAVTEEEELNPRGDMLGSATDLEGALEKILFTPVTLYHNLYCSGPCGRKKKFPTDVTESKCPDCPGTFK